MKVEFRRSQLFNQTLAKHKGIANKLAEFIQFKTNDPMARFGKKDQHFAGGDLGETGLIHAHLTNDISVLYRRSGRDPTYIDLIALLTHDDLGTGNPPNQKQQRKMAKVLSNEKV